MKTLILLLIACTCAHAADTTIYETDKYGNIQYHKPRLVVKGDRVYQADKFGGIQYDKPGYKIKGDRIYPVDKFGNVQYDKPGKVKK